MKTPTQAILGFSHLLQNHPERKDELIQAISRNAVRLQRLTNDILDVTRIESQTLKLKKEQFNLNDVIVNTINDITINKHSNNKNDVKILYQPKGDIFVEADKGRISQVIFNILNNAMKFTNSEEGSIFIISEKKDSQTIVSIKDGGTGIDPEILPRLFSKFTSRSFSGTGLGLFISKSIIEA